jgi:polyphosphate kinase
MNALDDGRVIQELYRASRAGVKIDLIVRGHCRLRPGLTGFSDNIRVISIVGRFLEHDRIYYFANAGQPQLFIGSADWRRRNLEERVEAIVPVRQPDLTMRLEEILETALNDNVLAWSLDADGRYTPVRAPGESRCNLHEVLMERACQRRDRALTWDVQPD